VSGLIVYIGVLAILTAMTLHRPAIALAALLCMFGLDQLGYIYHPFFRSNSAFTNLYILLLVAVAVVLAYRPGGLPPFRHWRVRGLSVGLFLYALLTLAWTPVDGWAYWSAAWPYLIASVLLAPLLLNRESDLPRAHQAFLWFGGIIVLFLATVPDWGGRSLMVTGADEDTGLPLALAQMSGYLLIIGVAHVSASLTNLLWLASVVIAALVVAILTASRGPLIFSIVSVAFMAPLIWQRIGVKNVLQMLAGVGLLVVLSYYIFERTDAYSERWETGEMLTDFGERYEMAATLLSEWAQSPLSVVFGLGNSASFSPDLIGVYPHIVMLEVLGEEGLVGFALLTAILLISLRQAKQMRRMRLENPARRAFAANFGCLVFTLLLTFKQGSLIGSPTMFLFAVVGERYLYLLGHASWQRERHRLQDRDLEIAPAGRES